MLISARLQPGTLRSLRSATQSFGQQPTSQLATHLTISLPDLDCSRHRLPSRKDRFSSVTAVTLTDDVGQPSSLGTYQLQLVLFVLRFMPAMPALTKLELCDLPLSAVVAAAACLPTGCPQLVCVELHDITCDQDPHPPHLSDLWLALAALPALRRLKLRRRSGLWPASSAAEEGLLGIGALKQLCSASVTEDAIRLPDLMSLVCLTKLSLGQVPPECHIQSTRPPLDLSALSRLQYLKLCPDELGEADLGFLRAFGACRALTSLQVNATNGPDLNPTLSSFPGLVRLHADALNVTCADLAALPRLRDLSCYGVTLPHAGARVAVPHVTAIDCGYFDGPYDVDDNAVPCQSVAATFPHLTALKWNDLRDGGAEPGWLWPPTPTGRLLHLRTLSLSKLQFPLLLAQCAVAADTLSMTCYPNDRAATFPLADLLPALLQIGPRLRRVDLCHGGLDDAALIAVAGAWGAVEEVTLRGEWADMAAVTDVGLAVLARLPRLRRVRLVRCSAVTPSAIAGLAVRWSLERIEACACARVGAADVAHVHALLGRPQLDIVHTRLSDRVPSWGWMGPS